MMDEKKGLLDLFRTQSLGREGVWSRMIGDDEEMLGVLASDLLGCLRAFEH